MSSHVRRRYTGPVSQPAGDHPRPGLSRTPWSSADVASVTEVIVSPLPTTSLSTEPLCPGRPSHKVIPASQALCPSQRASLQQVAIKGKLEALGLQSDIWSSSQSERGNPSPAILQAISPLRLLEWGVIVTQSYLVSLNRHQPH